MRSVIVVFGAGTRPDGRPSVDLHRRLKVALAEARRQPSASLIVTGGAVTGPAEGPVMKRWLVVHGVASRRILVEAEAKYTLDNAVKVAPLIAGMRATDITLITQRFHMARSAALLSGALRRVTSRPIHIRRVMAHDTRFGEPGLQLRRGEAVKVERDLATLRSLAQPPKIERAHAWAGSIKMHKTNQ